MTEGDSSDCLNKILDVMSGYPSGVSNNVLQNALPSVSMKVVVASLNKLLKLNKIEVLRKGSQLSYILKKSNSSMSYQGADVEEQLVLKAIENAGNNGLTPREVKYQCNLPLPRVSKILKDLENKLMVKPVVSVKNKKKVFMLYNLEPDHSLTGGTFYSGQEFETEFVDVLETVCYKYLVQAKVSADKLSDPKAKRYASLISADHICDYITNLKISKVNLTIKDIENILETLIYDGKVEKYLTASSASSSTSDTKNLYRATQPLVTSVALMRMPCGVCPVFNDCHPGGEISPATCVYMKEWLEY